MHLLHQVLVQVTVYRSWVAEVPAPPSTSVNSSPSTVAVLALQDEPLEFIVQPFLHLHRRWPPVRAIVVVHHHRLPSPPLGHCGEPSSTLPPPTGFPCSRIPPWHHLDGLSPPVGWNWPAGPHRWMGGGEGKATLSRPWAKRLTSVGPSGPGRPWPSGLSPFQ
jgi:hypothetical protein